MKKQKLNQQIKVVLLFVIGVILISAALILLSPSFKADSQLGVDIPGSSGVTDFRGYLTAIVNFCTNTLGPTLATLMIIIGGYLYMSSAGDTTQTNKAKDIIFGAIFGYLILFLLKLILNVIGVTY